MNAAEIAIDRRAPEKPAFGAQCNGCGLCCALEPCPLGMLRFLRRTGKCPALEWDEASLNYRCGLLFGPKALPVWSHKLIRRWIAAGSGCDFNALIVKS